MDYQIEKEMRDILGRGYAKALGLSHRWHFRGIVRTCVARSPKG